MKGNSLHPVESDDEDEAPLLVDLNAEQTGDNGNSNPGEEFASTGDMGAATTTPSSDSLCPVTVLAGFLGAGKTTLIQYILSSPDHGKKIAVIENEFGDGLDVESMIARDGSQGFASLQELIELPNGCVCCTVKDSLVECLENLIDKRKDLDYILIECSGVANPGPIASLFWLDDALESRLRLDGIVTMVDAKHILQQLEETEEAAQQIAFADRVLINKTDLVESTAEVQSAIRKIHPTVSMRQTTFSRVLDLEWILDANCYSADRLGELETLPATTPASDDDHHHAHSHHHDPHCSICQASDHRHTSGISTVSFVKSASINLKSLDQWLASILWPKQDEQASVLSKLNQAGVTDDDRSSKRLDHRNQIGQQIYRIKGILSVQHDRVDGLSDANIDVTTRIDARRHIVQAVHDLWEVRPAGDNLAWGEDEERTCKLVIIGKRLDVERLKVGFDECFRS